jgi:hypothetical protein
MNRISKTAKRIADAHIQARINNSFTDPQVSTKEELLQKLHEGETFLELLREVELRYCSVGSMMLSAVMNHASNNYKQAVYKGFKQLIDKQ